MIKALKLITGEEIICDVVTLDEMYKITKPAQIVVMPGDGEEKLNRLTLVPYAMYLDDSFIMLRADKVVWESVPSKKMSDYYSQLFGSGITLADASDLDKITKMLDAHVK